jgi:hypothetical protein
VKESSFIEDSREVPGFRREIVCARCFETCLKCKGTQYDDCLTCKSEFYRTEIEKNGENTVQCLRNPNDCSRFGMYSVEKPAKACVGCHEDC